MPTAKKATAKATAKKATAKKATAKKATAKKATAKKATAKKATAKKATARAAEPGDTITIDSAHVGSPGREGEVLEVVHGDLTVSYWVRWSDGHQSFITPSAGSAHISPASRKR